jgi:hypothetical protein
MIVRVPERGSGRPEPARPFWALPALLGASVGLAVGWLLTRKPGKVAGRVEAEGIAWHDRLGERLGDGFDAAVDGLREARARFLEVPPPRHEELEARLALVEGAGRVRVAHLGDGIVELTGEASDEAARAAVVAVARVPGVRAAVSRVWTPSSEAPAAN